MRIGEYLDRLPKWLLMVVGVLLILLIGAADYAAGPERGLFAFYLIPIALVTWFVGPRTGMGVAVLSAMVWFAADTVAGRAYSNLAIGCWDAAMSLVVFLLAAMTLYQLRMTQERVARADLIDPLTGAPNMRYFCQATTREVDRDRRYPHPLTLARLEIDGFEGIKERLGSSVGDLLLQVVAHTIRDNLRSMDFVARIDTNEFGILFPEAGEEAAQAILGRIQKALTEVSEARGWPFACNIGMAVYVDVPDSVDEMLQVSGELLESARSEAENTIIRQIVGGGEG